MNRPDVRLLAIRSEHVQRILDGTKTVELRRRGWSDAVGSTTLLYSSGAERGIVGSFVVAEVVTAAPSTIWRRFGPFTALSKRDFDEYFAGARSAVAIVASQVRRLPDPIALEELRRRHPRFHVPQSYRFVEPSELKLILNGERRLLIGA